MRCAKRTDISDGRLKEEQDKMYRVYLTDIMENCRLVSGVQDRANWLGASPSYNPASETNKRKYRRKSENALPRWI